MAEKKGSTSDKAAEAKAKEAEEGQVDEAPAADEETKFPREQLIGESDLLLGEHRRYVVSGALEQLKGDGPVTVAQAQKAIEDFQTDDTQGGGK